MRTVATGMTLLALLSGCSSNPTTINTSQSLIMESAVLSAGITTDEPVMSERDGQQRASSVLYNQQEKPVTLHYRFYWYDAKGLEILPFERPGTAVVAPHEEVEISSQTGNLTASKVRLYLYL
ncbi:YcfL family protein [Pantoea sp. FN060301]|uniref:YcfL family protein n=1 Tax=Pantoea sp. FN060301 TaxID=3420380 RepID=UPI003D187681